MAQRLEIAIRQQAMESQSVSMTYVDDTFGPTSVNNASKDMNDVCVIIRQLLGKNAVNEKRTEGPLPVLQIIGWDCDMLRGSMKPSVTGLKKLI